MIAHDRILGRPVRVLEIDPQLGHRLSHEDRVHAEPACLASLLSIAPGQWTPSSLLARFGPIYALVVIDGMLCRETAIGSHSAMQVLVETDVLAPWPHEARSNARPERVPRASVTLTALCPVTVMVLAQSFLEASGYWPGLILAIQDRLTRQETHAAVQSLAVRFPRLRDRVLLTLWLLAERCGRAIPDGVVLPIEIPDGALSRLVGAERIMVTQALAGLCESGHLQISDDGQTILTERARRHLAKISTTDGAVSSVEGGPATDIKPSSCDLSSVRQSPV